MVEVIWVMHNGYGVGWWEVSVHEVGKVRIRC